MSNTMSARRLLVGAGLQDLAASQARFLTLPDPRTGKPAAYLLSASGLQELNWHKPEFSSWFVGDSVARDGGLYLSTPVDPLLLLLPLLERAKGDAAPGAGRYCDLEEVLSHAGTPAAQLLAPLLAPQLGCVCDAKEAGGQRYYRLDEGKALAWLRLKVAAAGAALRAAPGAHFGSMDDASLAAYSSGLLGEYLGTAWSDRLAAALGLPDQAAAAGPAHPPPCFDYDMHSEKRQRVGPKEAAAAKAAEARQAAKDAKRAKEAAGMRKLSSFFKKPAAA